MAACRFLALALSIATAHAVICESFSRDSCKNCTSGGECLWSETDGACRTDKNSADCGEGPAITSVGGGPAPTVVCSSYEKMHCEGQCTSDGPCHWFGDECAAKTEPCEKPDHGGDHGGPAMAVVCSRFGIDTCKSQCTMDGVCEWDDTKDDGDEIPGACVPVNKTCPDHGGGHDMPGHGGEDPAITVICSSYDEMHCQGCTSDGPCHWGGPSLGCTAKTDEKCETPNDGHGGGEHGNSGDPDSGHGVGHGDHGSGHGEHGHGGGGSDPGFVCDPVSEPCQKDSTFPLYCEAASADAASPVQDHHMMAGLYMPNPDPTKGLPKMHHGNYDGDAPSCAGKAGTTPQPTTKPTGNSDGAAATRASLAAAAVVFLAVA